MGMTVEYLDIGEFVLTVTLIIPHRLCQACTKNVAHVILNVSVLVLQLNNIFIERDFRKDEICYCHRTECIF